MARIRYRITIRGRLTEHLRLAFDGLGMEPGGEQTALVGEIRDQAHLYGVLDLVRELGLELVSVAPDARQNQSLLSERDRGACLPQNPPARPAIPLRTAAVTKACPNRLRSQLSSQPWLVLLPRSRRPVRGSSRTGVFRETSWTDCGARDVSG